MSQPKKNCNFKIHLFSFSSTKQTNMVFFKTRLGGILIWEKKPGMRELNFKCLRSFCGDGKFSSKKPLDSP